MIPTRTSLQKRTSFFKSGSSKLGAKKKEDKENSGLFQTFLRSCPPPLTPLGKRRKKMIMKLRILKTSKEQLLSFFQCLPLSVYHLSLPFSSPIRSCHLVFFKRRSCYMLLLLTEQRQHANYRQGCLCLGLCGPHHCSADTEAGTWKK